MFAVTELAETFAHCFKGQANHLAMQFGGPVYLVGSMLTSEAPGDVDLRLAISREDIEALFGTDNVDCHGDWGAASFRRCREELKQSRRMTRRWCRTQRTSRAWDADLPRIDFQFVIVLFDDLNEPIFGVDKPRLRLDSVPSAMFTAGRGEP